MKIGEVAAATGTQIETIRYYEREGLLTPPERSSGNYRIYAQLHVDRLAFIRRCRALDMNLDEIRALLHFKDAPNDDCSEVNALLDEHIGHVATRMLELRDLDKELRDLRDRCRVVRDAAHCGILTELSKAAPSKVARHDSHVGKAHDVTGRQVMRLQR